MVSHTKISISASTRRFGHDLKSVGAIGSVGVRMKNAANVGITYETRELVRSRKYDLTKTFPQFRLDELQTQGGVNFLLFPSNDFPAGVQACLIKRHLFLGCQFAQLWDVLLGTRREHQGGSQTAFIGQPDARL